MRRLFEALDRISLRLLLVHLVLLLVPIAGLEFARIHERQLLASFERDMRNQSVLVARALEDDLASGFALEDTRHARVLAAAATTTRTRVRVLDRGGVVVVDSHGAGAPEGPEPRASEWLVATAGSGGAGLELLEGRSRGRDDEWPAVARRREVRAALAGRGDAITRVRFEPPAVFLFVTEPIRSRADGSIAGAVYVVRSTRPVMIELYRIRAGLIKVLLIAVAFTMLVTLVLAWSISRPLRRLSKAAKRIAAGERGVVVPVAGAGEIRELGTSFRTMTEQLDQRMRYISDFAADVAHEFKSPLTSIRGAAELLAEGAADDPEARRKFLRNIETDVDRLDRLVSRLLELSRIEASSVVATWTDLPALLQRVADRSSTPDVVVEIRIEPGVREIEAREADLETALVNLADNAVRFSPAGAKVEVRVEAAGERIRFHVRDHGPGIPEDARARIFDRFYTTDTDRHGTGLGLAIVESVARAHGGTVHVESPPAGGADLVLDLPIRTR